MQKRRRIAIIVVVVGLLLGAGQGFVQRKEATYVPVGGLATCLALIPACGYCPGDPRPYCGMEVDQEEVTPATHGVPFAVNRKDDPQVMAVNFATFFVPALLAGFLIWPRPKKGKGA